METRGPVGEQNVLPAKPIAQFEGHTGGVMSLCFSPDRGLLASGSQDGTGRVWALTGSASGERSVMRQHGDLFPALTFFPNSRMIAAGSGSPNGLVWVFDITNSLPQVTAVLRGARGAIHALAVSSDGRLISAGGDDYTVRVWEPGTSSRCEARTILTGHTSGITAMAFSPDSMSLASASGDGTVRVWTLGRIRSSERAVLTHENEVAAIAYGPDGRTLATACHGGGVRLWDLTAVKPVVRLTLSGHRGTIHRLVIAEDRTFIGVGSAMRVFNWDSRTGRVIREFEIPLAPAASFALMRDGRYVGTGNAEGTVSVFRAVEKKT